MSQRNHPRPLPWCALVLGDGDPDTDALVGPADAVEAVALAIRSKSRVYRWAGARWAYLRSYPAGA